MSKKTIQRIAIVLAVIALVVVFKVFELERYLSLAYLKSSRESFAAIYAERQVLVIGTYMLIYIIVTALSLPGAAVMSLAGGALFGLWAGTIAVSFASSIGATLACFVSRFILRDWVQNKFGDKLGTINRGIENEGAFYLFTMRLIPAFPFFVINLVMGLTKMPLFTFYWVSQVGMLAGTVVYINAGKELAKIDSLSGILSPGLIISFVILGLFPITVKKMMGWYRYKKGKPFTSGKPKPTQRPGGKKPSKIIARPEVILKADMTDMSLAAAELLVTASHTAVAAAGRFTVALSGGSTPRVLYKVLAETSFSARIPWDRTHIFWVDERCVPVDDLASNYGTAKKDLLSHVPIPRENIHPMAGDLPPDEGVRQYQEILVAFFKLKEGSFPVFDLIFLGIGKDGHVASLFPGQAALEEEEKLVAHVKGGEPFVDRITLTLPVLNHGRNIVFLASGKGKAEITRTVFKGLPDPPPAARVEPLSGRLTWILDLGAATLLSFET